MMMPESFSTDTPTPGASKPPSIVFKGAILLGLTLLVAGAWSLPFLFESSSMRYRFGLAKTLLRLGKIAGISAALLLFSQAVLLSRFRLLERSFSLTQLRALHRADGVTIAALVLLHPLLVLGADNFVFFPYEWRYWPEFLGAGLLTFLLILIATALWRSLLHLDYAPWLRLHRAGALLAVAGMSFHILFVSETFTSGLPRALMATAAGLNLLLIFRLWWLRTFMKKNRTIQLSNPRQQGGRS